MAYFQIKHGLAIVSLRKVGTFSIGCEGTVVQDKKLLLGLGRALDDPERVGDRRQVDQDRQGLESHDCG